MGTVIYPGRIPGKMGIMDSELDQMSEAAEKAKSAMVKVNGDFLSGLAWGNTKEYFLTIHIPLLQSFRLWSSYQKEENSTYKNAGSALPQIEELNQDTLTTQRDWWVSEKTKLLQWPLGGVLNLPAIWICQRIINQIEEKIRAIETFIGATTGTYSYANGVLETLEQAQSNLGKISYDPSTHSYDFSLVDAQWLRTIKAYQQYRDKLDTIEDIYDKVSPFKENGDLDFESVDWKYLADLVGRVHPEDLDKFDLTEEEIIAITKLLDQLDDRIWDFLEAAEKHGCDIASLIPFSKELIWAAQTGSSKLTDILSSPFIEGPAFNFINNGGYISRLLGFTYTGADNGDYYYTVEDSLQLKFGFMDYYDEVGSLLGMDLDEYITTFNYGGKEYRIELWKGNYGFGNAYGGEFGIYYRDAAEAIANPYVQGSEQSRHTYYQCLPEGEQLRIVQRIYDTSSGTAEEVIKNDTDDYANGGDHFWNLAIQTDRGKTKDTLMNVYKIDVPDAGMRQAMTEALSKDKDIVYAETGNGITITFK